MFSRRLATRSAREVTEMAIGTFWSTSARPVFAAVTTTSGRVELGVAASAVSAVAGCAAAALVQVRPSAHRLEVNRPPRREFICSSPRVLSLVLVWRRLVRLEFDDECFEIEPSEVDELDL